jgi:hypothetical protein
MSVILLKIKSKPEGPSPGYAAWEIHPVMKIELNN